MRATNAKAAARRRIHRPAALLCCRSGRPSCWLSFLLSCLLAGCAVPESSSQPEPHEEAVDFARLALVRGEQPEAIERFARRLEQATRPDDSASRLEALVALALVSRAGHDPDAAEDYLARAQDAAGKSASGELATADSDPSALHGWMDYAAAAIALDRNRPEPAAGLAEKARARFLRLGDQRGVVEATALLITARGLYQARFEEAYALVDRCLATAAAAESARSVNQVGEVDEIGPAGSHAGIARLRCLNARASLAYNLADYETAVDDYTHVAAPDSPLPDKLKSTARLNLALCHVHLGQYGSARLAIEQALESARTPGQTEYPVSVPTYYRGYLQSRLGDPEGALVDYRTALELFRREKNLYFESFVLIDIGDILLQRGQADQALEEYERSRAIYRDAGNPRGLMLVEEGIGRSLLDKGDRDGAEARLRRALELAGEVRDNHGWARIAAVLGDGLLRASDPVEAEGLLERAVEVSASSGLLEEQFRATLGLARVRRDRGLRDEAVEGYRAALSLLDRIRDELRSESQHLTFSESRNVAYREAVDLALEAGAKPGAIAEAFDIGERARARALLEVMQQARLAGGRRTPDERRARLAILARISRAQSRLLTGGADADAATVPDPAASDDTEETDGTHDAKRDLLRAQAQLERFDLAEAARLSPAARPRSLGLAAVRERMIDSRRTLAVFWLGPQRSCVWRIRQGEAAFHELGDFREIAAAIDDYRQAISREPGWHNPIDAWREPARRLARLLRIETLLDGVEGGTVYVVPDGPLHGVPLEPLLTNAPHETTGGLLGDRFDVVYLPSASFLAQPSGRVERANGAPRLFALGDPGAAAISTAGTAPAAPTVSGALPGARSEVRRIAALFREGHATVRIGEHASKDELRNPAAVTADILHIAARTVAPDERPGLAGIALAGNEANSDGFLRLHEIAALDLTARLAVLSACSTGLGRPVAGEGLHGLARAFLIAGVPAVVPSQWDVSDRATAELMERFYRGLLDGRDAPAALAGAMRAMRRESLPMYAHPYYWAPFIYFGLPPESAGG